MMGDQFTLNSNDDLESTLNFLEVGIKKIILGDNKRFTLVLGNTGCGKSTFVQWIAGDDSKLIAEKVGIGEFVIKGDSSIGGSVLNSMTLFPELKVKNGENVYDCPGFSDTRSASHEIVITYFLKYLCDHVESLKIVLVVEYSSVRFGRNRTDFMNMVSSAVDFIKDIEKFQQSIVLLVTKVENVTDTDGEGKSVPVSDEDISENIWQYIKMIKIEIEQEVRLQIQTEKLEFYSKALKIIEFLTTQKDKIVLFRAPTQKGNLNKLENFREGKEKIWKIINQNVKFTRSTKTDFGYTISDKCTNLITQMVQKINDDIRTSVTAVALKIQNTAAYLIEEEISKINKFDGRDCDISNAEDFILRLLEIKKFIEVASSNESFFHDTENISEKDFTAEKGALIKKQLKYFSFLQTVSKTKLSNFNWSSVFQSTRSNVVSLEIKLKDASRVTSSLVKSKIKEQLEQLVEEYVHHFKKIYENNQKIIENFPRNVEVSNPQKMRTELEEIDDFVLRINNLLENMDTRNLIECLKIPNGLKGIEFRIANILRLENNMRYLEIISNTELSEKSLHKTHFQQFSKKIQQHKIQFFGKVSDKSAQLTRDIEADIKAKANFFRNFIDKKIDAFDLISLPTDLQNFLDMFKFFSENISIQNLATKIRNVENFFNIEDPSKVLCSLGLISMVLSQKFLLALNREISFIPAKFLNHFSEVYSYLEDCRKWFVFLNTLYMKLSDYSIQKHRDLYNVENLSNWGKGPATGIKITQQNYQDFVNIVRQLEIDSLDGISHQVQESKLTQLNTILEKTLNSKFQIDRSIQKIVTMRGEFIKFSDFVGENGELCLQNGQEIEELKIFALCSVFVDQDLDVTGSNLKLVIITPKLKFWGGRRIIMDGKDADPLNEINSREPGSDGRAGNPGGSAGSFYAIIGEILNGENLTLSLNGGKGGNGEDGAEGKEGQKGINTFGPEFAGQKGGDGGNGGKPGLGGFPGSFKCITFSGEKNFSVIMRNGTMGAAGSGGVGGKGGKCGDISVVHPLLFFVGILTRDIPHQELGFFADSGADGKTDIAGSQLNPSLPPQIDISLSIDQYKNFLIGNLKKFYTSDLKKFYLSFSENEEINQTCTIFSLLDEFNTLSRILPLENNEYMHHLLTRIGSRLERSTTNDEKKLLKIFHIAVSSKINLKKHTCYSSLIVDIERYLLSVEEEIELFKHFRHRKNKREIIKNLVSNFSCNIDQNIEELQKLIEIKINPFIAEENSKINSKIIKLLNEIEDLRNKSEINLNSLEKDKKELECKMGLKILFGGIQTAVQILSVFFPSLKVAGSICSMVGSIGDFSTEIQGSVSDDLKVLKSTLIHYKTQIKNQVLLEAEVITNLLDTYENSNPNDDGINNENSETKLILTEIDDYFKNLQERANFSMNCSEQIDLFMTELSNVQKRINKTKRHNRKLLNLLSNTTKVLKVAGTTFNFYSKIKKNHAQIDDINEVIEMSKLKIKMIEVHKKNVEEIMKPMLTSMFLVTENMEVLNERRSQTYFDVAKWNIRNMINDMQVDIAQFIKGFEIEACFKRCLERVGDAMTTIVQICDRIEEFQSQKNMINFIADVTSVDGEEYKITDPRYAEAINSLEISIKAEMIIKKRNAAVRAFKQWVFPFAEVFLKNIETIEASEVIKENFNVVNFAEKAAHQVKSLKKLLENYKTNVFKHDNILCFGTFNSENSVTNPFFIWENAEYFNEITQLLSGETVLFYSNVLKSQEDAIKFNSLELRFKIRNQQVQQTFNELLKRFKVTMIHSGNSFYTYKGNFFLISCESSQSLYFSFEKDQNNKPIIKNEVVLKINKGDLLLSPYTMWQIKLEQVEGEQRIAFDELAKFRDQIDLELVGEGSYVRKSEHTDLMVDDHYERISM